MVKPKYLGPNYFNNENNYSEDCYYATCDVGNKNILFIAQQYHCVSSFLIPLLQV